MTLGNTDTIEQLTVNTIRTLSMDAVQAANSGHPGTPMAMAPVAYKLWRDYLRFDPELPVWANRDRFVLSVGHASALLYSLLHLAGGQVGQPGLRDRRRARRVAGGPAPVPAAGLQVSRRIADYFKSRLCLGSPDGAHTLAEPAGTRSTDK
jgi:transketolase